MKKKILAVVVFIIAFSMLWAVSAAAEPTTVTDAEGLRAALTEGKSVVFGNDITVDGEWVNCHVAEGATIDGNGNEFTIGNVGYYTADAAFYGKNFAVKNLTITLTAAEATNHGAIDMNGGSVEKVSVYGKFGNGIIARGGVTVDQCYFGEDVTWGINTDGAVNGVVSVTDTEFDSLRAVALYGTETFTGNVVNGDKGLSVATATATITGNEFNGARALSLSVDGIAISGNTILGAVEANTGCTADLSANYWGGSAPASLPEGVTAVSYYEDDAMSDLAVAGLYGN